ncbi:MAG: MFS transporter [Ignavibacteria bacterium CG_4_8_14_3_um_filter_37_9]|nr:MFS transporter [Ignavibacteria bacterium]OIO14974.1 MAG: MFS transporter [Ignavibacteria bacterium CG1_02_37_35]PIS43964.1 MAG: MFS transporter [Ignavibacteria bacterium CG08_land_8_20_14_0_20_37_9]PIX00005.1 MAG: MFS transporter [Ignavibacteria bacterium CG_4_8_14_3_um_filter_37_9]PIX93595.1 MAG: MFS transporter [Ignavibacteria bacterium CG_4_10_14_3_um_filter_37_18]PJC60834.1 MAG: MFS transporter [Ignavibacteria bacterium CG_4_9_14_0_2_um_filter_37_13]
MSSKLKIFVWTLFDFANTSYSIIIVTFLYAVYFKQVVNDGNPVGDLYWSFGTSIAMLITAIISPILGAIADYSAGKKRFLLFFTLQCILATALLTFVEKGDVLFGLILFIIANVGFEAGLVFYDAFLPEITAPKNYGRVSGYGFGMGYVGSLVCLALVYPFIQSDQIRITFLIAAVFFLIFSLPLFLKLHDTRKVVDVSKSYLSIGFNRVFWTLKHIKDYKNLSLFLLSYFFYIEGVNTVIFFSGNYASTTLHFSNIELLIFFITVQTTAIFGSVILGIVADSIGQKKTIMISLVIWLLTILLAYFTEQKEMFYVVGLLAGVAMGSSQSTSRSLMSKLTPDEKKTELFGFYSFFGKSSAILGPLVFGYISYITGNQRYAISSIAFFFLIGLLILFKVNDSEAAS